MSEGYEPIRSYQRIFRPERRIYQVEGRTLPVPGGVPLRWLGWATAALLGRDRARLGLAGRAGGRRGGGRSRRPRGRSTGPPASSPPPRRSPATWIAGVALGAAGVAAAAGGDPGRGRDARHPGDARRAPRRPLRRSPGWRLRLAPPRRSLGRGAAGRGAPAPARRASCGSRPTSARRGCAVAGSPAPRSSSSLGAAARCAGPACARGVWWRGRRRRAARGRGVVSRARAGRGRGAGGAAVIGFPLRYARRNVLIGPGGEAAALYRAETISYPFLPVGREVGAAPPPRALRSPGRRRLLALARTALLSGRALRRRAGLARRSRARRPRTAGGATWRATARAWPSSTPTSRGLPGGLARPRAATGRRCCAPSGGRGGGSRSWPASARRGRSPAPSCEALAGAEQRAFERLGGVDLACGGPRPPSCSGCCAAPPAAASASRRSSATGSPTRWSSAPRTARPPTSRWSTTSGAARARR